MGEASERRRRTGGELGLRLAVAVTVRPPGSRSEFSGAVEHDGSKRNRWIVT